MELEINEYESHTENQNLLKNEVENLINEKLKFNKELQEKINELSVTK